MTALFLRARIRVTFILCLSIWLLTAAAYGATLFDASMQQLAVGAEKVAGKDFNFVVLGDSRDNDRVFRKALAAARKYNPLFILHQGDYSSSGSTRETEHFLDIVRQETPRIPLFVVFGNHERRKEFETLIGPRNYIMDLPRLGFRAVVVDNADNALKPGEIEFLRENLTPQRAVKVVAMHVPPQTERWSWHSFRNGSERYFRLISQSGVSFAFYGHVHIYDRDTVHGVPSIITGGAGAPLTKIGYPGEAVYHIIVVKVKNGTISATMVPLDE